MQPMLLPGILLGAGPPPALATGGGRWRTLLSVAGKQAPHARTPRQPQCLVRCRAAAAAAAAGRRAASRDVSAAIVRGALLQPRQHVCTERERRHGAAARAPATAHLPLRDAPARSPRAPLVATAQAAAAFAAAAALHDVVLQQRGAQQ
jgi:hypothetical protein